MAELRANDPRHRELTRVWDELEKTRLERDQLRAQVDRLRSELAAGPGLPDGGHRRLARERLSVLYAIDRLLATASTLSEAIPAILAALGKSDRWLLGIFWRVDPGSNLLRYEGGWQAASKGPRNYLEQSASMVFPCGHGLPGRAWETREPQWVEDLAQDPSFVRTEAARRAGLRSCLVFPIWSQERVYGVIEFYTRELRAPDPPMIDFFMSLSRQLGQFIERKEAEVERHRALAILKAQQEASIDGILVVDENRAILSYNECLLEIWGIPRALIERRDDDQLRVFAAAQTEDPEQFQSRLNDLYQHPLETGREEIRLRNGRVLDRFTAPVLSAEGRYIGRVWSYRDVTERKRSEASASRLAAIVHSSEDAIIGKTLEGIITDWNPAAERIYGYPAEMALGQPVSILFPADLQDDFGLIMDRIRHGQPIEHCETVRRRRDGTLLDVSISVSPIRDAAGRLIGAATIARDISERKRMERTLREQVEQLQELDRIKGIFVNTVTHELRTPLTSIKGYLEFLEEGLGGPLTDTEREFLAQIRRSEERLERLVTDLLEFARLESGTFKLACEEGDLTERIQSCVESLRPQSRDAGLTLQVVVPTEPLITTMDTQRVGQVILNLIGNAIKFTPPGGRITVTARKDGADLRCEVTDTGPGISAEDRPRLFKLFSQLPAGAKRGGSGLGLSISKALIEAHGGQIGVDSTPGEGSTFWFTLPLVPNA